ncbi:MAG: FKBP-type peptidyl-prolyl cis-trans isomerase [Gemmatimonadota bacterium]
MTQRVLPVLVAAVVAGGCGDAAPPAAEGTGTVGPAAERVRFAPALGIVPDSMTALDGGIRIQDLSEGRGATAEPGLPVTIAYQAWLPDGTLYEKRPDEQGFGPAELVPGAVSPSGLATAIVGMKEGGVRRIVLPPEHGYGLVGRPAGVPAAATLIFEVRLISVDE